MVWVKKNSPFPLKKRRLEKIYACLPFGSELSDSLSHGESVHIVHLADRPADLCWWNELLQPLGRGLRSLKPFSGDGKWVQMELSAHPWVKHVPLRKAPEGGNSRGCGCPQTHGHSCAQHAFLQGEVHCCWVRSACSLQGTTATKQHSSWGLPCTPIQTTSATDGTKPKTILQKTPELDS